MSITVNINAPKRMIKDVQDFYKSPKWMGNVTGEIKKRIVKNTSQGKDANSKKFRPYSKAYAKKKGHGVDLNDTGAMMDAVSNKVVNSTTGVVFVKAVMGKGGVNRNILATYHNFGQGKNPVREFMNIPASFLNKIVKLLVDDPVQKIINKHR